MIDYTDAKKVIKESIILILITSIIAFTINFFHPNGFILISKEANNYKKIIFISSKEALIKHSNNIAVFIDSRSRSEYIKGHIQGAVYIPAHPVSISLRHIKKNLRILSKPREIVIYCTGTSCGTSESLAKRLIGMKYKRSIYIIKHGIPEWKKEGYPLGKERAGIKEQ